MAHCEPGRGKVAKKKRGQPPKREACFRASSLLWYAGPLDVEIFHVFGV